MMKGRVRLWVSWHGKSHTLCRNLLVLRKKHWLIGRRAQIFRDSDPRQPIKTKPFIYVGRSLESRRLVWIDVLSAPRQDSPFLECDDRKEEWCWGCLWKGMKRPRRYAFSCDNNCRFGGNVARCDTISGATIKDFFLRDARMKKLRDRQKKNSSEIVQFQEKRGCIRTKLSRRREVRATSSGGNW